MADPVSPQPGSAEPIAPEPSRATLARGLGGDILRQVLLDPVRQGRLGWSSMPSSLRAVTALALGGIGLLLVIIVLSRWLVALPATTTIYGASFPVGLVYPLAVMLIIGLALIFVAALQMHAVLRWCGWIVTSLLIFLGCAALLWRQPGVAILPGAAALVLALLAARPRFRFRVWELVLTMIAIGGCWSMVWVVQQFQQPGVATSLVTGMVGFLQPFILPLAVIAGLALAEIAVAVAYGTVQAAEQRLPRLPWPWIVAVLGLAAAVLNAREDTGWGELGWSAAVVATGLLGWVALGVGADADARDFDPERLWNGFRPGIWVLAVAICLPYFVTGTLSVAGVVLPAFTGVRTADQLLAVSGLIVTTGVPVHFGLVAVGGAVASLVMMRRGRLPSSRVCWIAAVVSGVLALDQLRTPYASGWTGAGLCLVLVVTTVTVVALLRWRARFTTTAAVACCASLAICLLYPLRGGLADPVTAVVGTGVASVLLLSSIWQLLTEGAVTRGHSAAVPRVGRLLFFLGYQLLWVLSAACLVITRDPRFADLAVGIEIGDQLLGTTLLLSACAGLLTVAASGQDRVS